MKARAWKNIVFASLLLTYAVQATAQATPACPVTANDGIMCDVTGDGSVSTIDATHVLQFVAGLRHFTAEQQMLADATGNGHVTALDATRILQASMGKAIPGSHCGQLVLMH